MIDPIEKEMIHGVLALADNPVASVMTPRPDVYWIDLDDDPKTIATEVADCPYSRLVVVRGGDIGRPLGVVQKNDLVSGLVSGGKHRHRGQSARADLRAGKHFRCCGCWKSSARRRCTSRSWSTNTATSSASSR